MSKKKCLARWLAAWASVCGLLGPAHAEEPAAAPATAASAAPAASAASAPTPDTPPPSDRRAEGLPIDRAVLSPDGKHVAAVATSDFGHAVVLIDTQTFASRPIASTRWVREGFYDIKKDP